MRFDGRIGPCRVLVTAFLLPCSTVEVRRRTLNFLSACIDPPVLLSRYPAATRLPEDRSDWFWPLGLAWTLGRRPLHLEVPSSSALSARFSLPLHGAV